jgi:hypothetical protein
MGFMLPFLGQAGASFLPMLLGHLFGGDPNKAYRNNVNNILAPQNMSRLTQGYYQSMLGSPAYSLAQRQIGAGTNATMGNLARNAGMSGLSNSGVGNLGASIGPSLAGNAMAGLTSNMWNQAQQQAQNNVQQQLWALTGQMPPSQGQQYGALGIAQLGPLLQQLFQQLGARGGLGRAAGNVPMGWDWPQANPLGGGPGNQQYPVYPAYGPPMVRN